MKIGFLHSRIRKDEKLLLEEIRNRNHNLVKIDTRDISLSPDEIEVFSNEKSERLDIETFDVVVNRAGSYSRGIYSVRFFESHGIPAINSYSTANICGNKVETTLALEEKGIQTPKTKVAFTKKSALQTAEKLGYPIVIKPLVGSWARLLAKANDREAAEAVFEHKEQLGHYEHSVFYLQEYVEKPGRDIRVAVTEDKALAAMYRENKHWVTNVARGAETRECEINEKIREISIKAAEAVGGGFVGVDIIEIGGKYTVVEVNHSLEFKALEETTGIDISSEFVDYIEDKASNQ